MGVEEEVNMGFGLIKNLGFGRGGGWRLLEKRGMRRKVRFVGSDVVLFVCVCFNNVFGN